VNHRPHFFDRREFGELLLGKTEDQVIAAVGWPDRTEEMAKGRSAKTWFYSGRVRNPGTGKAETAIVEFEDGKAVLVHW
jgi:hypothetical protein